MILPQIRAYLKTAFAAQLPGVQIKAVPPGENAALRESVWIQKLSSTFDWRSLGHSPSNRIESLQCITRVRVYREGSNQTDVAEVAIARCEEILGKLEDAIETDFSLGNIVTFGLAQTVAVELVPQTGGWVADGTFTLQSKNYPHT